MKGLCNIDQCRKSYAICKGCPGEEEHRQSEEAASHHPVDSEGQSEADCYKPCPDTVCLNMNDLTGGSLAKIYEIVKEDAEDEENIEAAKLINRYLTECSGL